MPRLISERVKKASVRCVHKAGRRVQYLQVTSTARFWGASRVLPKRCCRYGIQPKCGDLAWSGQFSLRIATGSLA